MTAATIEHRATLTDTVRAILEANPAGMTDDELWLATGPPWSRHGSVVRRRADVGAVPLNRDGRTILGSRCTTWVLP